MNELYHHGIEGQKWGVKNGPPYPLDRGSGSRLRRMERSYKRYNKLYSRANRQSTRARQKFTRSGRQRAAEKAGTLYLRAAKYGDRFMRIYDSLERHVGKVQGLYMSDIFEQYDGPITIEQMFNDVSDFQRTMNQTLETAWIYQRL